MVIICPLMSSAQNMIQCIDNCALNMNGECALLKIAQSLSENSLLDPNSNVLDSDSNV